MSAPDRFKGFSDRLRDDAARDNPYNANRISDLVDDAVITDTNSPVMLRSSEFATTNRARIVRETPQCISYAKSHIELEFSEVLLSRTLDDDTIHRFA